MISRLKIRFLRCSFLSSLLLLAVTVTPVLAQAQDGTVPQDQGAGVETFFREPSVVLDAMRSLFFTDSELQLLQEARLFGLNARAPDASELNRDSDAPVPPGMREVSLSGITYNSSKEWTLWLNGQRVRPNAIPSEVLDLEVYPTYVNLRWYDAYTRQVFPIRLHPHQRFNLDTRIFLPGEL